MKKVLLCAILGATLAGSNAANAISCAMPTKEALEEIVRDNGWDHFDEKVDFVAAYAGQTFHPFGVALKWTTLLYDYNENLKSGGLSAQQRNVMAALLRMRERDLFAKLLSNCDEPGGLELLEENDMIFKRG